MITRVSNSYYFYLQEEKKKKRVTVKLLWQSNEQTLLELCALIIIRIITVSDRYKRLYFKGLHTYRKVNDFRKFF